MIAGRCRYPRLMRERKSKPVKHPYKKRLFDYRFDFEIGFLIKSPCRECEHREDLPECTRGCVVLDKIHSVLSHTVSCAKAY